MTCRTTWSSPLSLQLIQHPAQLLTRVGPAELLIQYFPQSARFQQPIGFGLFSQRLRQFQLNRSGKEDLRKARILWTQAAASLT